MTTKSYFNEAGLRIEEHVLIDGAFPDDYPIFVAHGVALLSMPGQVEPRRAPISVGIPEAKTVQEAYKLAGGHLQKAAEELSDRHEQQIKDHIAASQIARKNQGPPPGQPQPAQKKLIVPP